MLISSNFAFRLKPYKIQRQRPFPTYAFAETCGQDYIKMPRGTIRGTVLIETITAAFEMEEILYELREHSSGLNCGRWDYIFSVIGEEFGLIACIAVDAGDGRVLMLAHMNAESLARTLETGGEPLRELRWHAELDDEDTPR